MKKHAVLILAVAGIAASLQTASAVDLNLTAGGTGTINGGIFTTTDNQSTGTGVINPFVRLQDNGVADGYNASVRPVMPDVNTSGQYTKDIQLSAIPIVTLSGVTYYEFLLDINQTAANPLLSLDKLQIYTRTTALTSADALSDLTGAGSTLRYNLDAGGNNSVRLNYDLNNGSGSGDLFAYIPTSLFGGSSGTDYLYLYSSFGDSGDPYSENDGFEEWAVRTASTPPPPGVPDGGASIAMLGMGLVALGAMRRKLS